MKKSILIIALVSIYFTSFSQHLTLDSLSKTLKLDTVVNCAGSQADLYNKALITLNKTMPNTRYIVNTSVKDDGTIFIAGKADRDWVDTFKTKNKVEYNTFTTHIKFKLRFFAKDNKFRIIIDNITFTSALLPTDWPLDFMYLKNDTFRPLFYTTDKSLKYILSNLITSIANKSESDF